MDDPVFLRDDKPEQPMTNRQTYNMVTDTVGELKTDFTADDADTRG